MTNAFSSGGRCVFAILAMVLVWHSAIAEVTTDKPVSQYLLDHWRPGDDFPAGSVYSLLQTRDRYLWIGATEGLWRFDGVRFVSFDRTRYPRLLSNRIRTLFEDSRGVLWIGTSGGGLSKLENGRITTITSGQGLPTDYVRAIAEDRSGSIWVGTDGEGVCKLTSDTIIAYGRENSPVDPRVTSLAVDETDAIWVGTYNGLYRFSAGQWTRFDRSNGLTCDSILCLHESDGELWIGTYGGGVVALRHGGFFAIEQSAELPGRVVTGITGDTSGGIWVTMLRAGVSRIWHGKTSFRPLANIRQDSYPICILRDVEGSVWVGLQNDGLLRLRNVAFTSYPTSERAGSNPARSIMQGPFGRMWVGTADGLMRMNEKGTLSALFSRDQPKNVLSVTCARDGSVWVGTIEHGLYRYQDGIFRRISLGHISTIWALYTDSAGTIWAGSNAGLARIREGATTLFTHNGNGLSHDDVRAICQGKDGVLWVGTSYGLNRILHDSVTVFTTANSGISNDVIVALQEAQNGDLWVGTLNGFDRLRNGKFTSFSTANGLPDDEAGLILEADDGYLWVAGDKSFYRIKEQDLDDCAEGRIHTLRPTVFGKADGVNTRGISGTIQPAAWKSRDGKIWFATKDGVVMTDQRALSTNVLPPIPVIEGMSVDSDTIGIDPIPSLSYDVYQFEIDYTAATFVKPQEVRFRYRLKGLSDTWINAGDRRSAYFTRIPPGRYVFQVSAAGENGIWSKNEATLGIWILPPFWMAWWFRTAALLFLLGLVFTMYKRHTSKLRKEKELQLHFTRQLLEGQEAERKRIAAELHDGLGQGLMIIKNLALLSSQPGGDPQEQNGNLARIAETAGSTLDDVRRIAHNLRPINLERFGLTESLKAMLETMAGTTSLVLRTDIDDVDGLLSKDEEIHFFRIVQEAMNNVLKHSASPSATVQIRRDESGLRCVIEDQGRGFDPVIRSAGLGLSDITERVKILNGTLNVQSRPGAGTRIDVTIPGSAHA